MKKFLLFVIGGVFVFNVANAQASSWQPSAGHAQVPIWPGAVPDAQATVTSENMKIVSDPRVAGGPFVKVGNVSRPTLTVYSAKGKKTGAKVKIA